MRSAVLMLLVVIGVAAAGYGACRVGGREPHLREMIAAAVVGLAAGELAMLPAMLSEKKDPAVLSQAALIGTVAHMFLTLVLAAMGWVAKLTGDRGPFLFWLLAFYWATLVVMVVVSVRILRAATQARAATPAAGSRPPPNVMPK